MLEVAEEAGAEELVLSVFLLLNASTAGVCWCSSISRNRWIGVACGSSAASDIIRNTASARSFTVNSTSAGLVVAGDDSACGRISIQSKQKRHEVGSASGGHKASSAVRDISNAGTFVTTGTPLTTYV